MRTSPVGLHTNNNYWQARWIDDHGNQRGKSLGNRKKVSRKQALAMCQRIAEQHILRPGSANTSSNITLGDWIKAFEQLTPEYADSTRRLYDRAGDLLLQYFGKDRRIDRITRHDAGLFRAWMVEQTRMSDGKEERAMSESTIRKHIRHCKSLFGCAVRYEHLPDNPFDAEVGAGLRVDKDWRYLDEAAMEKLLDACPNDAWRALLALCRFAGLRLGEATRITWSDIDHDAKMITVQHEGAATTKKRRRTVPMTPRLQAELLRAFASAPDNENCVVPISKNNLYRKINATVKRAEMDGWSKPFHTLRKNCESDWLAKYPVMDVCDWLGHDPTVASKHYHQTGKQVIDDVTGQNRESGKVGESHQQERATQK